MYRVADKSYKSLGSLIWSHWHWDHIGDASKLPPSVDIVVGPGFREAFVRGNEIDESQSFIMSQDMEYCLSHPNCHPVPMLITVALLCIH